MHACITYDNKYGTSGNIWYKEPVANEGGLAFLVN